MDVSFLDDGGELRAVIADCNGFSVGVCGGERMGEIEVRVRGDAFEKVRRTS